MKIKLERSGGFTGIPLRANIDSDSLAAEESKALQEMVKSSGFFDLPAKIPPSAAGADRFNYKITIETEGQSHTVEFSEANTPAELAPLVQKVTLLARSARKG
jgi:hypothetical protein